MRDNISSNIVNENNKNHIFSSNMKLNKLAYKVIEKISEGILITNESGKIEWINPAVTEISEYSKKELIGGNPSLFKSNKHDKVFYEEMWNSLNKNGEWEGDIWNRRKNGEAYLEHLKITSLELIDDKKKYIAVFNDLTKKNVNKSYIKYNANYDFLTELPNRFLLKDRLLSAMKYADNSNNKLALIYINLDKFKRVNDGLGHDIGDELLKEVSKRILELLEDSQTLARMGTDEFSALIPFIKKDKYAVELGNKIADIFNVPFKINDNYIYMDASIGISIYPEDGYTEDILIKNSQIAMNRSKEISASKVTLYNSRMNNLSNKNILIENEIRRGIENKEFQPYYQPKINAKDGSVMGLEALIRWNHPRKGLISPNKFITIAEETGLINYLGEFMLKEVIIQQKKWTKKGYDFGPISINLSPKQLKNNGIKDDILNILSKSDIKYSNIEFEITESAAIESEKITLDLMNELAYLGVHFSIDDFGTGYSSLS